MKQSLKAKQKKAYYYRKKEKENKNGTSISINKNVMSDNTQESENNLTNKTEVKRKGKKRFQDIVKGDQRKLIICLKMIYF